MPPTPDCRAFGYIPDPHWAKPPAGAAWPEVAAVATDRRDRVFVFNRGPRPLMLFAPDGTFLESWADGLFTRAHGLFIGPDDSVYTVDDLGHTVRKFAPDGRLVMTLGGTPSDTGATSLDYRNIARAAGPFHYPTDLALSPDGDLYVTDGYGNARLHKFSPDGRLMWSRGEPGDGPGQFHLPHGVAVDRRGTVYVADRENSRVQLFSPDGDYLAEWPGLARPCEVFIDAQGTVFVAELGYRCGFWPGVTYPDGATGGRVSAFDTNGRLIARWGGGAGPCEPGDFYAPHDIWADSRGDLYVSEVTWSAGASQGLVSAADCHPLQKFVARGAGT